MIADELRLYQSVMGIRKPRLTPAAMVGLVDEPRDPVCGRAVDPTIALVLEYAGRTYFFNSPECRQQFQEDPERYLRGHPDAAA